MTTAKPQSLSLYFDPATATAEGLPPVYRNDIGYAILATHPSFNGKDDSVPLSARFTGRANYGVDAETDHVLAANGHLTKAGESYCRIHGIGPTHAQLVAYTKNTSQQKIYDGYTPPSQGVTRSLAAA